MLDGDVGQQYGGEGAVAFVSGIAFATGQVTFTNSTFKLVAQYNRAPER